MPTVTEEHRLIVIVKADQLQAANSAAASWDPNDGGDETFGSTAGLSADGTEPATHYACNTAATDDMRSGILNAATQVPFVEVYEQADGWDWESALADAGLQRIEPEV